MKWFKHMTRMRHDVKLRRVIAKYGIDGYGVYNAILESIAETLDSSAPEPDLEETAQDIAEYFNMDTVKVEEITWFCLEQQLFTQDEITGRIVCQKMYKFIDDATRKSAEIQKMIEQYREKDQLGIIPSNSEKSRPTPNRSGQRENKSKNKRESKSLSLHPSLEVPMNETHYLRIVDTYGQETVDDYIGRAVNYVKSKGKPHYKDYAATAENWIKRDNVKPRTKPSGCPECGSQEYYGGVCKSCGYVEGAA